MVRDSLVQTAAQTKAFSTKQSRNQAACTAWEQQGSIQKALLHYAQVFAQPGLREDELIAEGRLALVEAANQWQTSDPFFRKGHRRTDYLLCRVQAAMGLCLIRHCHLVQNAESSLLCQLAAQLRWVLPDRAAALRNIIMRRALEASLDGSLREDMSGILHKVGPARRPARLWETGEASTCSAYSAAAAMSLEEQPLDERGAAAQSIRTLKRAIHESWTELSGRERFMMRRGFWGSHPASVEQMASSMHLSAAQVHLVRDALLQKLRQHMKGYPLGSIPS